MSSSRVQLSDFREHLLRLTRPPGLLGLTLLAVLLILLGFWSGGMARSGQGAGGLPPDRAAAETSGTVRSAGKVDSALSQFMESAQASEPKSGLGGPIGAHPGDTRSPVLQSHAASADSQEGEAQVLRQYPVAGDPTPLAERLRERFGHFPDVRIVADRRTRQILVLAPPASQMLIDGELRNLQAAQSQPTSRSETLASSPPLAGPTDAARATEVLAAGSAAPVLEVISLQQLTSEQFEAELLRIFPGRLRPVKAEGRGLIGYELRVNAPEQVLLLIDPANRLVMVRGTGTSARSAAALVRFLDQWSANQRNFAMVSLQRGRIPQLDQALEILSQITAGPAVPRTQMASPELVETSPPLTPPEGAAGVGRAERAVGLLAQQVPGGQTLGQPGTPSPAVAQPPPGPRGQGAGQPMPPDPGQGVQPGQAPAPEAQMEEAAGLIGPVQIEWLEGLDVLIIRGHERDVQRVAELIQQIEAMSVETVPTVVVYPLRHVNCEALTTVILQIYQQVYQARLGSVLVLALVKPNALLIAGRLENVQTVQELAKQLDRPVAPETQFRVFRLRHAPAEQVQTTLEDFYADRGGLGTRLRISLDFRSNSVLVEASPRDMAEISEMINRLDVGQTEATSEIRVFKLKNSLASELAPILQDAISGQAYGRRAGQAGQVGVGAAAQQQERKSAVLRFLMVDERGERMINSGILTDAVITADTRTNSLIVTASPESMPLIAALIEQLDGLPVAEAQIKVFTLVNGDAQNMAEMLQAIFGQQVAAQAQVAVRTGAQVGESALVPVRFAVDVRTNSIIASGTAGDLAVVEALLLRLDTTEVRARMNKVFRLKNSPASDVSSALNEFLRSERQLQQIAPGLVSAFEQIEREVVIVPEPVSNALIVSATPRFFEDVIRLVEQLDERPPMVLIQVLIAEVALGDTDEFGVELGLQDSILFDRSVAGTGTLAGTNIPGFLFNSTDPLGNSNSTEALARSDRIGTQGIANLGVGRLNSELGYGGLVLSASSESVSILLRALKECRRLDVLSRPQIMTMDNQTAEILVGQEVPTISGTQFTDLGGQINTIQWRSVGLIVTVTPRISPDRLVVMEIDATKSDVGPEAEGIPVSVAQGQVIRAPRINTTSARTVVSAMDGQTVVLGGLITKSNSRTQRKVPFLGDVPLLGRLFRYDASVVRRTELLIIMTPHIVTTEADVDRIKQMESARMDWCLRDVIEVHGADGLTSRQMQAAGWQTSVHYRPAEPTPAPAIAPESIPAPNVPQPVEVLPAPAQPSGAAPTAPAFPESKTATGGNPRLRQSSPDTPFVVEPPVP